MGDHSYEGINPSAGAWVDAGQAGADIATTIEGYYKDN